MDMSMFTVTLTIDTLEALSPEDAIRAFQGALTEVALTYEITEETADGKIKRYTVDAPPLAVSNT